MTGIGLVLTPGFADWEYAFIAGTGSPFYGIEVRFFSPGPGRFQSQGGLPVTVENGLDQCLEWRPSTIAIIGGTTWESADAPDIGAFLLKARSLGSAVAGICAGTLTLARAGLLDDIPHTSNSLEFLQKNAAGYKGAAHYRTGPGAVAADGIITAPGPAPVGFTSAVFESAGLPSEAAHQFRAMLAAEHG